MTSLTDMTSYADAQRHYSTDALWALFDGTRTRINVTHECLDRHAHRDEIALRIAHSDGRDESLSFADLSRAAAQMAHFLQRRGVSKGDRVAIMLDPSLPFYAAIFGAMKLGAVAVPMFTLFGPDAIRARVEDCEPRVFFCAADKAAEARDAGVADPVIPDTAFLGALAELPATFDWDTGGDDLAVLQYTSGTTRLLPAAVHHSHRSIVTLMVAALYGTGLRPGDRFFCPSSPAWGHGLWHGTLAPLALGIPTGTISGRFEAERLMQALQDYGITNLSAAATHFRMMRNSPLAGDYRFAIRKLSFTGEPIDSETARHARALFGTAVCSMYGTTEIGVIIANYPGAPDFSIREGALGKPVPGVSVAVHRADGTPAAAGEVGELMVRRRNGWFHTKDLGRCDADGYFYHAGRADDVIISAGWTMSAVEIENAILHHPAVAEAAAIGVPDPLRGQVVKAFVVLRDAAQPLPAEDIQAAVRARLSRHEYPRLVQFVSGLPKTPAGKVNRKALRDAERA